MKIEVRVYKKYDMDILALYSAGYSLARMMRDAICAYAKGQPFFLAIGEIMPFDIGDKNSIHIRLCIPDGEFEAIDLLSSVKDGYKGNFSKQLLRNALIQQNLSCFFSDADQDRYLPTHMANLQYVSGLNYLNLHRCSEYLPKKKQKETKAATPRVIRQPIPAVSVPHAAFVQTQAPQPTAFKPQAIPAPPVPPEISNEPPEADIKAQIQEQASTEPIQEKDPVAGTYEPLNDEMPEDTGNEKIVPGLADDPELMKMFMNM